MQNLYRHASLFLKEACFDSLAVCVLDFNNNQTASLELFKEKNCIISKKNIFFDLASLTKPLTLSSVFFLMPEIFDSEMKLLLNHKAGIISGGRLGKNDWETEILSFKIKESSVLYSDYSALRLMLELEGKTKKTLKDLSHPIIQDGAVHWQNIGADKFTPATGYRNGKRIIKEVHDPNAFTIKRFLSHAGLFASVDDLGKILIHWNEKYDLLKKMKCELLKSSDRFVCGWDRVCDLKTTLAGDLAGKNTFGHLGFTGTSIWIDPDKMCGYLLLTNATKEYWYDRELLNKIRRTLGNIIWSSCI